MSREISKILFNPLLRNFFRGYVEDAEGLPYHDHDALCENVLDQLEAILEDPDDPDCDEWLRCFSGSLAAYREQVLRFDLSFYTAPAVPPRCDFFQHLQLRNVLRGLRERESPEVCADKEREIAHYVCSLWLVADATRHVPQRILDELSKTAEKLSAATRQAGGRIDPLPLVRDARQLVQDSKLTVQEITDMVQYGLVFLTHEGTPIYDLTPDGLHYYIKTMTGLAQSESGRAQLFSVMQPYVQKLKARVGEDVWSGLNADAVLANGQLTAEQELKQQASVNSMLDMFAGFLNQHQSDIQQALVNPSSLIDRVLDADEVKEARKFLDDESSSSSL